MFQAMTGSIKDGAEQVRKIAADHKVSIDFVMADTLAGNTFKCVHTAAECDVSLRDLLREHLGIYLAVYRELLMDEIISKYPALKLQEQPTPKPTTKKRGKK